jgi:hypothetical protein
MVLPLTSWSEVLAEHWLARFVSAYNTVKNCEIVGATGSYEGIETAPFPNIHIRTTAFFMDRKIFLRAERGPLKTKWDNNLMEAGPNGLTKQVLARNKVALVVGRDSRVWEPLEWPQSRTFRSGDQQNLLISDNRTHDYEVGSYKARRKLTHLAWRDPTLAMRPALSRRLYSALRWKFL